MIDANRLLGERFRLRTLTPEGILAWTVAQTTSRTALSISFGGPGVVLVDMLHRLGASVPVIFVNTGFLFPETFDIKNRLVEKYSLNVLEVEPATDPGHLYQTDTDGCCAIRKVEPMSRAIEGFDIWISALRRDQGETRKDTDVIELHEVNGRPVLKVYPLAYWTRDQVWKYIHDHGIPYHPLLDQGYKSIGCWPCTRKTAAHEDERAGRWSGTDKIECGLHTFTRKELPTSI